MPGVKSGDSQMKKARTESSLFPALTLGCRALTMSHLIQGVIRTNHVSGICLRKAPITIRSDELIVGISFHDHIQTSNLMHCLH